MGYALIALNKIFMDTNDVNVLRQFIRIGLIEEFIQEECVNVVIAFPVRIRKLSAR